MRELEIPERAYDAAEKAMESYVAAVDALDVASDAINVAAPIIVAAELRRLVHGLCSNDAVHLLKRADELDSEGSVRGERNDERQ